MKIHVSRWGLLALLVPLAVLGWLRAQEGANSTAPPVSVTPPAETPRPAQADSDVDTSARDDEDDEPLEPGEKLSADNNLSWPVDI
jgi:hypothetical protein